MLSRRFPVIFALLFVSLFLFSAFEAKADEGGSGFGVFRCIDHQVKDCKEYTSDPSLTITHQLYRAEIRVDHFMLNDDRSAVRVDACISQSAGGMWNGQCEIIYDVTLIGPDGPGVDNSRTTTIQLNELDDVKDYNAVNFNIRVDNAEGSVAGTAHYRRVSIDSFTSSNFRPKVGEQFNISWTTNWATAFTELSWSGTVGTDFEGVDANSNKNFTANQSGTATFTLEARGPNGNGPITESRTINVMVKPVPPPPPPPGPGPFDLSISPCQGDPVDPYVDLSWSPSANAVNYRIERRIWSTGGWGEIGQTNGTSFKDNDAKAEADNYYRVRAENNAGSIYSDEEVTRCPQVPRPTVDLNANPATVNYNTSSTLSWISSDVSSCTASGDWSGSKSLSGSESTGKLKSNKTYTLTCSSSSGSASDSVTVNVFNPPPPNVDLDWNGSDGGATVNYGATGNLEWVVQSVADSCSASSTAGDFSGSKPFLPEGSKYTETKGPIISSRTYTLTCSGPGGQGQDGVTLNVIFLPPISSNVTVTQPNYCLSGPAATVGWTYSDSSGSPQSAYQVQIDDQGSFNTPEWDSAKVSCSDCRSNSTPQGYLQFNKTYKARVRVWNQFDTASNWAESNSWKTPAHAYPQVNFIFSQNSQNQILLPQKPVQFTDQTQFFDSNPKGHRWAWLFGDGGSSTQQNPTRTYANEGAYNVTLTATDNSNQSCSLTKPLTIKIPNPIWKEVNPGG